MKLRALFITLAVLVVLDAGFAWRNHTRRVAADNAGLIDRPLLDLPVLEQAHRIVIREKPQSKVLYSDEDGFEVRRVVDKDAPIRETILERNGDQRWVVANCLGLDADPNWLGQTMRDLSQGRLIRYVTDDPKLMETLGLNAAQVRFEDEKGRVIRQLDFGHKDGGDNYQFVRMDNGSVFLAKHETELVGDALTWIVSRLLSFEPADVREVELPFQNPAEPPLLLRRAAHGAPFLPAQGTMPDSVSPAVEKILAHLLTSPVMLAVSHDSPAAETARLHVVAHLRLMLFDGREYKINYGTVPKGTTGLKELEGNEPQSLAFAFYECSDPHDITARYNTKAILIYSQGATVGALPESRAKLFTPAADPAH